MNTLKEAQEDIYRNLKELSVTLTENKETIWKWRTLFFLSLAVNVIFLLLFSLTLFFNGGGDGKLVDSNYREKIEVDGYTFYLQNIEKVTIRADGIWVK